MTRLLDIRLHNASQLAGFAKAADLPYFLDVIGGIGYAHDPRLAPTEEMLAGYRKAKGAWADYERQFVALMQERGVPDILDRHSFDQKTVLLCSEPGPQRCHRRLVAELLAREWGAEVEHL